MKIHHQTLVYTDKYYMEKYEHMKIQFNLSTKRTVLYSYIK